MRIAHMVKLDYKGRIVARQTVEYHGHYWQVLVETGWITDTVQEIP